MSSNHLLLDYGTRDRKTVVVLSNNTMNTKLNVITAVIFTITIVNVRCIVPKYLQNIERPVVRQRTLEDITRYSKHDEILLPPEEKPQYMVFIKEPSVNLLLKSSYHKNIVDSAEIDKNAPVEDFDDYSVEEIKIPKPIFLETNESNTAKETFGDSNEKVRSRYRRSVFETKESKRKKKMVKLRQKRMPAMYTGRYKSQEVDDVLNSISEAKPKNKITNKKLNVEANAISNEHTTKERYRRNTNNIIEEENLATTISGFKFTGKLYFLNNDLVFKNINS